METPAACQERFREAYREYEKTEALDRLRAAEYARLDDAGHVYLDYTGGGLYAAVQLRRHFELLERGVFGNPHSHNPSSSAMTELVEKTRRRVLEYFNAPADEYVAIFTANASNALKLVGESYPFAPGGRYLLTFDNHNSVNGIREFARAKGAAIRYAPLVLPEMRVDEAVLDSFLEQGHDGANNLFAFPAQSNFSGVQHPLEWIAKARSQGWDVLVDAAAYVPCNRLDIRRWKPDFVPVSFYKMFGYPTGVGCLIARRDKLKKLHRPWFAGGTITVASVQGDRYWFSEGAEAFEDGTVDYLNIPAVAIGLDHLEATGVETIHERCRCLIGWLIAELRTMQHPNGRPLVRLYGPPSTERRGGTATMNFYDAEDQVISHLDVEQMAAKRNISLRTGCFCNPGGGEVALELSKTELIGCFRSTEEAKAGPFTIDDFRLCVDGKSTGAVRVSVGLASNYADVARFLEFARGLLTA
ncbi:MAG: aminotransferase class V-fold PLP-dependent enzyme [Bryobacterales bacterium]